MMNEVVNIKLNPVRLASIIDRAVIDTNEVVAFHFNALAAADLNQPAEVPDARHWFSGAPKSADERRALHESWMLAKAFQELLRAVRHSLEEAHVFAALLSGRHKVNSSSTLADFLMPFQRKAASLKFPELMDAVNGRFEAKINFAPAYVSLQTARNCLEHRAGVVSRIETKNGDAFVMRVPRIKMFYMRGEDEIELEAGHVVDPGDGREEVDILMKFELVSRSFILGSRISFSLAEFNEVAFACHFLGKQLATKLPRPPEQALRPDVPA